MGKSLIIPGADFSANAIEITEGWLTSLELSDSYNSAPVFNADGYACHFYIEAIKGKTISKIRVITATAGTIVLKSTTAVVASSSVDFLDTVQIEVPKCSDFTEFDLPQPLTIPSDGGIMVYAPSILKYRNGQDPVVTGAHYIFTTPLSTSSTITTTDYIIHSIGFYGS